MRQRDEIQFCTRLARQLIDRYFPGDAGSQKLPRALVHWADGGSASRPWHADSENARLEIRLFAEGPSSGFFMLLLEETISAADSPAALLCLGLTAREAEVLYWIAHGKTSPEIALILDAAMNTIKKHVQNILLKLGVETRLAAALRATEVLGLKGVDPSKFRADLGSYDVVRFRAD